MYPNFKYGNFLIGHSLVELVVERPVWPVLVNMLFWRRYYLLWLDFYTAPTHSEAAHKEKLIQVFADRFYSVNVTQASGLENNTSSWMAAHAESLNTNSRHSCDSSREVLLSGIPGFHAASG